MVLSDTSPYLTFYAFVSSIEIMSIWTRHGFLIEDTDGLEDRPKVYRCGGVKWCEECSVDYINHIRQTWQPLQHTQASPEKIKDDLERLVASQRFNGLPGESNRGWNEAIRYVQGILEGDPVYTTPLTAHDLRR